MSRVALVTGGSRGIGRAVARELAAAGHRIAVNFIGNRAAAEETVDVIGTDGGEAIAVQGDVGDDGSVAALIGTVAAKLGPIEILVNNAGITRDDLLLRMKPEAWDDVIRTNLRSVYLCSRAALHHLSQLGRRGSRQSGSGQLWGG